LRQVSNCVWCGRDSSGAAACLRCAPGQGHGRDLEHDAEFEPDEIYDACIDNLRALLDCYGIAPIAFEPLEQEWADLNVSRYLETLDSP
jgi:hypothetical protein